MHRHEQSGRRPALPLYGLIVAALLLLVNAPSAAAQSEWTTSGNNISNTNSGNVGIGTASPVVPLHVLGTANITTFPGLPYNMSFQSDNAAAADVGPGFTFAGYYNTSLLTTFAGIHSVKENATLGNYGAALLFSTRLHGSTLKERMRISSTGMVGIGTDAPKARLDLKQSADSFIGGLHLRRVATNDTWSLVTGSDNNFYMGYATDASGADTATDFTVFPLVLTTNNRVGIGTSTPTTKLDVSGTVNATAFTVGGSPFTESQWATSGSTINYAAGNVGIGTASPTKKLQVVGDVEATNINATGNITATGNISAKYQDVAEWVPAREKMAAGTVVVLDTETTNQVTASTHAYDTKVAGVVSAQPGVILGQAAENKTMVATTGRVKVKVDATRAPIKVGDLLVTSDLAGVAMKSEPLDLGGTPIHRPGTLIGKALESLETGTGEILVLLSLQ